MILSDLAYRTAPRREFIPGIPASVGQPNRLARARRDGDRSGTWIDEPRSDRTDFVTPPEPAAVSTTRPVTRRLVPSQLLLRLAAIAAERDYKRYLAPACSWPRHTGCDRP